MDVLPDGRRGDAMDGSPAFILWSTNESDGQQLAGRRNRCFAPFPLAPLGVFPKHIPITQQQKNWVAPRGPDVILSYNISIYLCAVVAPLRRVKDKLGNWLRRVFARACSDEV
jgi:hypothetical protein